MVMWNTGSCPKCGGDIFADVDENVLFDHCLQCSYMRPRANEPCPQCYFGMYYDYDRGERYSYCSNCGYNTRMHRVF